MSLEFLNQFNLPPQAIEAFTKNGVVSKTLNRGNGALVSSIEMAGHDKGVAFRFFVHDEKHDMQTESADMLITEPIEMIEWTKDRKNKITERVRFLPHQLLKFNKLGECTGGLYREAYLQWKSGNEVSGLSLDRWGSRSLTSGDIKTLNSEGIWTVQQLAEMPEDRIVGRFPKQFIAGYHEARQFVHGQAPMEHIKQSAEELLLQKQINAKLSAQLDAMAKQLDELTSKSQSKTRGRPKKVKTINEILNEEE